MLISIIDLPSELQILIFEHLPLFDIVQCEKVSKTWYNLLSSSNASCLYKSIDVKKREGESCYLWLSKKLSIHKAFKLNFSGCRFDHLSLSNLLFLASDSLETLDISFHILTSKFFTDLSFISLKKLIINDSKLKDSNLELVLSIPQLEHLNINYNSSLIGRPLSSTDRKLKALWFEGCERIEYQHILTYVQNHGSSLSQLGIDGEYYSCDEVCTILTFSPNLLQFAIEFANEMSGWLSDYLIKNDWEHLKIRRALNIPTSSFSKIFEMNLSKLLLLNLAECTYVDDSICIMISKNCPNLENFTLTWCSDVSDSGIEKVIFSCSRLKFVDLTGLKEITDRSFPLEPLGVYRSLEMVILEKCNKISDEHLWKLSEEYPGIKIKNYYGEFKEGWTGIAGLEFRMKKARNNDNF